MKIEFFGDSITDAHRERVTEENPYRFGAGYVSQIAGRLQPENPEKYDIVNRGISGNTVADLYARVKSDVWNEKPDVLSILIGVNDVWHDITAAYGVELDRYEKIYTALIEETLERLPNVTLILCEPFVLRGAATEEEYDRFLIVKKYAEVVKRLAKKFNACFLPLQDKLSEMAERFGAERYLSDGVHPTVAGAGLIAEEWIKLFRKIEKRDTIL